MALSEADKQAQKEHFTERGRGTKAAALLRALRYRREHGGSVTTPEELMDWPGSRWAQLASDAAVNMPSQATRQRVIDALSPTPYERELHEREHYPVR